MPQKNSKPLSDESYASFAMVPIPEVTSRKPTIEYSERPVDVILVGAARVNNLWYVKGFFPGVRNTPPQVRLFRWKKQLYTELTLRGEPIAFKI